eukprot:1487778-Pleurochrysis_carterae.AAC.1
MKRRLQRWGGDQGVGWLHIPALGHVEGGVVDSHEPRILIQPLFVDGYDSTVAELLVQGSSMLVQDLEVD